MTIMTDLKSSYYQQNLCHYLVRSRPQCGQNIFNFCLFLKLALIYRCAGFGVRRGSFSRQLKCWRNPRENKRTGRAPPTVEWPGLGWWYRCRGGWATFLYCEVCGAQLRDASHHWVKADCLALVLSVGSCCPPPPYPPPWVSKYLLLF